MTLVRAIEIPQVIGLVGTKLSGKGAVAGILQEMGYEYFSLSDTLRKYADKLGESKGVFNLQDLANKLRAEKGNSILAELILEEIGDEKGRLIVIDGIRHPEEIKRIGKVIIAVDAEPRVRFERIKKRGREGDPETWEEFLEMEQRESWGEKNVSGQQVAECIKLADYQIWNNTNDMGVLRKEVDKMLVFIEGKLKGKKRKG